MSWESMIDDVKELCNYVCESEQSSYDDWIKEIGVDSYGHIYQLAERIRSYFDPPVDDIPF